MWLKVYIFQYMVEWHMRGWYHQFHNPFLQYAHLLFTFWVNDINQNTHQVMNLPDYSSGPLDDPMEVSLIASYCLLERDA